MKDIQITDFKISLYQLYLHGLDPEAQPNCTQKGQNCILFGLSECHRVERPKLYKILAFLSAIGLKTFRIKLPLDLLIMETQHINGEI